MQLLSVQRMFQRDVVLLDQFIDRFTGQVGDKTRLQHQQLLDPAFNRLLTELLTVLAGRAQKADPRGEDDPRIKAQGLDLLGGHAQDPGFHKPRIDRLPLRQAML